MRVRVTVNVHLGDAGTIFDRDYEAWDDTCIYFCFGGSE